jgi:hypothetical protein
MLITTDIKGLKELQDSLDGFSDRRMQAAIATALTRTAMQVRDQVRAEMARVFDRPTPYTLSSLFVRTATADKLQASVWVKDDSATTKGGTAATKYLLPQIDGGQRRAKRFERALQMAGALPQGWYVVPGPGAKLDSYGNVSNGQIIQILSQLRITLVAGATRNMAFDGKKQIAAQRKAGGRFFVIKPGPGGGAPGIYQREFLGRGVTPVLWFRKDVAYKARFDFYGIAGDHIKQQLPINIDKAVQEQIGRLAKKLGAAQ